MIIWYFYKHHIIQNSPARAVICPHAGYRYSGPTAAYSFRQIDPRSGLIIFIYFDSIVCRVVKTIFVLGPSHHVRLSGCAVTQHVAYQTPLYDLRWRGSNVNLSVHLILLQHQYRNQSRAPQHRPLWNNDSGSWRGWAQHWNATPLHSKGARREPQLVFLNH